MKLIPIEAITEARHALAEKCIAMSEQLENLGLVKMLHRRRLVSKVEKTKEYLSQLDAWLEGVKK